MKRAVSPTVLDDEAPAVPVKRRAAAAAPSAVGGGGLLLREPGAVISRLLAASQPPSILASTFAYAVATVAVIVAISGLVISMSWILRGSASRFARQIGVPSHGATMHVLGIAVVFLASAAIAFCIFHIGSRRWIKAGV